MHFPKVTVTVVNVNAKKASASPVVESQMRSGYEFVDANDAFYRAVVAEIKLRRPRTTVVGKVYQKLRQWSWESDKINWGLIMTRCGASAHLEEFSEDWKLQGLREVLLMPVKPQRFFWTPKSY